MNPKRWSRRGILALVGALAAVSALVLALMPRTPLPPKRGFYYWKTQWAPSPQILESLRNNGVERLYMRFFDVGWDGATKTPQPVAPIDFKSPPPREVEIVPVVFILNTVFLDIPYEGIDELAARVWRKVGAMAREQETAFHEFQIDCDWSDRSRRNYFHFAELLHRKAKSEGKILSATIRLHQIKYSDRTGIPPVDRGMLMFYNFGKIAADSPRSSIFNSEDAGHYASFIAGYPMSLDVALPLFSWTVHSRSGSVLGLLEKIGQADIAAFDGFQPLAPNRYTASRSFFFRGRYFIEGDRVLVEETTPATTREAAELAKRGAGRKRYGAVAVFDLDEHHPENYEKAKIDKVWNAF